MRAAQYGIRYMDYHIPERQMIMTDFVEAIDNRFLPTAFADKHQYLAFIDAILELKSIRVEESRTSVELLSMLLMRMVEEKVIKPSEIDLIVLIDEQCKEGKKNIGQLLQFQFGMKNAYVMNISGNHCANMEIAISTVTMLESPRMNNILLLNATLANSHHERIIGNYGILGDAAGLMLLSKNETSLRIHGSSVANNGRLHVADVAVDNSLLHAKYLLKCVRNVFEENQLQIEDVAQIVVQNANPLLNTHVLTSSGLGIDRMYRNNFGKYGHLDCLDFLVNLKDLTSDPTTVKTGDRVLSLGMGWAGSYSSILFSKN